MYADKGAFLLKNSSYPVEISFNELFMARVRYSFCNECQSVLILGKAESKHWLCRIKVSIL